MNLLTILKSKVVEKRTSSSKRPATYIIMFLVLVFSFFVSFVFYLFPGPSMDGRIFYYPSNSGNRIVAEKRSVPAKKLLREQIDVFMRELFTAPFNIYLSPAVPDGSRIRHVAVVSKIAYIDLSKEVMNVNSEMPVTCDEVLENLRFNLLFNFPKLQSVVITIEGHQVKSPPLI